MGLKGKMIGQTKVKHSGVSDAFHDVFRNRPHDLAAASPEKVQGFTLIEGAIGVPGSKICWHYNHEGKDKKAEQIIEEVDEAKQWIKYRWIGGDILEDYKTFTITHQVENNGEDDLVTWTFEYEKKEELGPHPGTFMNFFLHMVEEIEAHHLNQAQ